MSRYTKEFKGEMLDKVAQGISIQDIIGEAQLIYPYFNESILKEWISVNHVVKENGSSELPEVEVLPKKRGRKPYIQAARTRAVEMKKVNMSVEQIKDELSKEFPSLNLDKVDEWLDKKKKVPKGRKPFLLAAEKSIKKMKRANMPIPEIKQRAAEEFPNLSIQRMNEFIGDYIPIVKLKGRRPSTIEQKMEYRMTVIEGLTEEHIGEIRMFFQDNCTVDAICRYMRKQHGVEISPYDVSAIGKAYNLLSNKQGIKTGAIEEITRNEDGTYSYLEKHTKGRKPTVTASEVEEIYEEVIRYIQMGNVRAARQLLNQKRDKFSGQRLKAMKRLAEIDEAMRVGLQDDNSIAVFYNKVTSQLLEDGKPDEARQILEEKVASINTRQLNDEGNLAYSNLYARLQYIQKRYPKTQARNKLGVTKRQENNEIIPDSSKDCIRLVHEYMMAGKYQTAKRFIKEARKKLPNKEENPERYDDIVKDIDFYEEKLWEAVLQGKPNSALVEFENVDMPEILASKLAEIQENILLNRLPTAQKLLSGFPPENERGMEYNLVRAQLYFATGKIRAVTDMKNRLAYAKRSEDKNDRVLYAGISRLSKAGILLGLDKKTERQDKMQ